MVKASCPAGSSSLVEATATPLPLSRVPTGEQRRVAAIEGPGRAELEREGLMAGSVVTVLARTPLGGPVVVLLGRTRLALSADVAAQVSTVAPVPSFGGR